jgi:hypothetical protein
MADPGVGGAQRPLTFRDAPGTYVVVAALLAAALVALLYVGSYAHDGPVLWGFPFFYWYSILWLLLNAVAQVTAYQLLVARRRRRGVRS